MPKYRVIARQIVYEFAKVEAESPKRQRNWWREATLTPNGTLWIMAHGEWMM